MHFNNLHSPRDSRSLITCKIPVKITSVGSRSNRSLDMTDCMMNFSPTCLIVTQMTTREREKKSCRDRHRGAYAERSRSTARKIDRGGWANLLALHNTCPLCNWSERERKGLWRKKEKRKKNRGGALLSTQEAMLKVVIENNGRQPRCAPYIRAQKDWANFPPPAAGVSYWAFSD